MFVEILNSSKIQIISSRNQVITYEAMSRNPQIPRSLVLYFFEACMGLIVLFSSQINYFSICIPYI